MKCKTTTGSPAFTKSKYVNKNLQFLDLTFKERRVISNIVKNAEYEETEEITEDDVARYDNNQQDEHQQDELTEITSVEETEDNEQLLDNSVISDDYVPQKKKKLSAKEKIVEEIRKGREERNTILSDLLSKNKNKLQDKEERHPLDLFFKSMCETAKTFPAHIAAETKLKICQVVNEMEIKMLKEQNYHFSASGGLQRIDTQTATPNLRVHSLTSPSTIGEGSSNSSNTYYVNEESPVDYYGKTFLNLE